MAQRSERHNSLTLEQVCAERRELDVGQVRGVRKEEESRVGGVGNSLGAGVGWGSPTPQGGNCYWCTRAVNSEREDETVWLVL